MKKNEKITSITFNRTSNVFINAGIVSIYEYLERCEEKDGFPQYDFKFTNNGNSLEVQSENLIELLEKLYYFMGTELYDTTGKNSRKKAAKYYFKDNPFLATPFFKMKTYGVASLITNDPTPFPKIKDNAIPFQKLLDSDEPFALEIADFYMKEGMKLKSYEFVEEKLKYNKPAKGDSKIFLNEPYIKLTRLEPPKKEYFQKGEEYCYISNEGFKKLVDVQNTIPFIKGINNFVSQFSPTSLKVSWKIMFALRFSPKLFFYTYVKGLDSLVCFGYDSSSLESLHEFYAEYRSMYLSNPELIDCNYMHNFKVSSFNQTSKNEEEIKSPSDYVWKSEIAFMLIYTMYKRFLINTNWEESPLLLVGFRTDDFSGTMRPKDFEYFNGFKFVIRIIKKLENDGQVNIKSVLGSLKVPNEDYQLARKFRAKILKILISGKSILPILSLFYYECYGKLISNKPIGYKNFKQLTNFTIFYENLINKNMDKELQKKAFDLGHFIGKSIIESSNGTRKENAKNGRKYIIHLQKARTLEQFNIATARIQNKYLHQVNGSIFREDIDENNFILIKQFAVIGALNRLNSILKPIEKKK